MFHFPTKAAPQFLLTLTDFLPLKISADFGTENKKNPRDSDRPETKIHLNCK